MAGYCLVLYSEHQGIKNRWSASKEPVGNELFSPNDNDDFSAWYNPSLQWKRQPQLNNLEGKSLPKHI